MKYLLKKSYKWFGYPAFFLFFLLAGIYCGLPLHEVKDFVAQQLEENIAKAGDGKFDFNPKVTIGNMSTWRLSGVKFDDVTITLDDTEFKLDKVSMRLGILKSLAGAPSFEIDTDLYKANISGHVAFLSENSLDSLSLYVQHLELNRVKVLAEALGLPVKGKLDFSADLDFAKTKTKKNKTVGNVNLEVSKFAFGPGSLKLPMKGFSSGFTMPEVKLGDLKAEIDIKDGIANAKIDLKDGDLKLKTKIKSAIKDNIAFSRLEGGGWLQVSKAFLAKNPKFQTIMELAPGIKKAQDDKGKIDFHVKGSLAMPRFKLGKAN
jgi:type II secretion system protein N